MRTLSWLSLICVLASGPVLAKEKDSDEPILNGEIGAQLDRAILQDAPKLWGSVLVARDGEILLAKGYGFADYASEPNTPRTLHEIASASKQVAATAVMHLHQRKKLKVTDSIGKYFKKVPDDKKSITIHHLLTHTSGISGNVGVPYASPLNRKDYVKQMMAEPLVNEPGAVYEYANVNYALAAAIVEEVSGKDFEDYCEKHLFKPAECKDTGFITDKDLKKSGRASARQGEPSKTAADWHYGWGYRGMGGVVTTVLDLFRWDRALRGDDVLKDEAKALLYTPYKNHYAYGWNVNWTDRGTRKVHHSGAVKGYGANVIRYLEDDVCIFVLSNNGENAFKATGAVEKLLFEPVSIPVELDMQPFGGGGKTVKLPAKMTWKASKKKKNVILQLKHKNDVAMELQIPKGTYAKMVVADLEQAVRSREADDDGEKPAVEAEMHLRGYGPSAKIRHPFGSIEIRAEFRMKDGVEKRATFILKDTRSGAWTGWVKMNLASAKQLLACMRKAM